jgi:hypothetical protein
MWGAPVAMPRARDGPRPPSPRRLGRFAFGVQHPAPAPRMRRTFAAMAPASRKTRAQGATTVPAEPCQRSQCQIYHKFSQTDPFGEYSPRCTNVKFTTGFPKPNHLVSFSSSNCALFTTRHNTVLLGKVLVFFFGFAVHTHPIISPVRGAGAGGQCVADSGIIHRGAGR